MLLANVKLFFMWYQKIFIFTKIRFSNTFSIHILYSIRRVNLGASGGARNLGQGGKIKSKKLININNKINKLLYYNVIVIQNLI